MGAGDEERYVPFALKFCKFSEKTWHFLHKGLCYYDEPMISKN
jgi:hypothetical protein